MLQELVREWLKDPESVFHKGNYETVSNFIMKQIVEGGKFVPINELTALYGLGSLSKVKTSYENLLKQRIVKQFGERIGILSTKSK